MHEKGLTLPELLLVIAIATVLITMAFPSFQQVLGRWNTQAALLQLHASLNMARTAAITRRIPVVVRANGSDWNSGWQVFADSNNNARLDSDDILLYHQQALPDSVYLHSNFGMYARYRPNGRSGYLSGAFMAGTWLACTRRQGTGGKLVMSFGGRVRSSRQIGKSCAQI